MNQKYYRIVSGPDYIFCAFFKEVIHVYEIKSGSKITEAQTIHDFGGNRLAASANIPLFFCGNFNKGIAGYSITNGDRVWINSKIKGIQNVYCSDDNIIVHNEKNELYLVSGYDGGIITRVDKVFDLFETDCNNQFLIQSKGKLKKILAEEARIEMIQEYNVEINDSFHIAGLFNNDLLVYNSYDSLTSYSDSGEKNWTSDLQKGFLINRFIYRLNHDKIYCLASFQNTTILENHLLQINLDKGKLENDILLKQDVIDVTYSESIDKIISNTGELIDLSTGGCEIGLFGNVSN